MKKNINVLIKPTDKCNLKCIYCYHDDYKICTQDMTTTLYKKIITMLSEEYSNIHFIWHGGEPLLMSIDFYREVIEINKSIIRNSEITISNSIQSNGTLVNTETGILLLENGFKVGLSYDGSNNEKNRGSTDKLFTGIEILRNYQGQNQIGAIKVILPDELNSLIDNYIHFKKLNINLKLNPVFECKNSIENSLLDNRYAYFDSMLSLLKYWIDDEDCMIRVEPFETYFEMLTLNRKRSCNHNSCLTKFICFTPNGSIYPCSRNYPDEYCCGNIDDYSSISEIFSGSTYEKILLHSIERRKKCISECDLYNYCNGGCFNDALSTGHPEQNSFFSCELFKVLFSHVKKVYLSDQRVENPRIIKLLNNIKSQEQLINLI